MRILVTGGLGFIGSHLVERLVRRGDDVTIVDDLRNNCVAPGWCGCETLPIPVRHLVLPYNCDRVYHCASVVGPTGVLDYAGQMAFDIVADVHRLLDMCVISRAELVDVSTSEIYGHDRDPLEEDAEKVVSSYRVRTEYAAGKLAAEVMIVNRERVSDLRYSIIRPFNVAGPRQRPDGGFVVPRFVIAALTGQPITVYGDGYQERAIGHVDDIVDGILAVPVQNEIWNIGNPANRCTINTLAATVSAKLGGDIVHVDPKTLHGPLFSEVNDKIPCIVKAVAATQWRPTKTLGDIIDDVAAYYRERIADGYKFDICAVRDR